MHISLDSALGRQRRLNQIGETISSIAAPTAAYSLRSLTGGDPRSVRVRRSSDDSEQDFTASAINSGALVNFVNEIQTLGTVTNSVGNNGFTLTNASSTGFTANLSSGTGVCGWAFTAKSGDKVTVSFDAVVRSGSPQFLPRKGTALSGSNLATVVSDSALNVTTGSFSFEFTYNSDDAGSLTFSEGDAGSDFDISNFQVTAFKGGGFVETWYDQSGNGRDSTNTTATQQPIIVDSGLFQDGLKFTHTDTTNGKRLFVPRSAAELGDSFALVFVGKVTASDSSINNLLGGTRGVQGFAAGSAGISIRSDNGTVSFVNEQDSSTRVISSSSTTVSLDTDFVAFATYEDAESGPDLDFSVNGNKQDFGFGSNLVLTSSKDIGIMNATGNTNSDSNYRTQESPTGICREALVYDTAQFDNRVALETNIINHYGIS